MYSKQIRRIIAVLRNVYLPATKGKTSESKQDVHGPSEVVSVCSPPSVPSSELSEHCIPFRARRAHDDLGAYQGSWVSNCMAHMLTASYAFLASSISWGEPKQD